MLNFKFFVSAPFAWLCQPSCASRVAPAELHQPSCGSASQKIGDFLGVAMKSQQCAVLFARFARSSGLIQTDLFRQIDSGRLIALVMPLFPVQVFFWEASHAWWFPNLLHFPPRFPRYGH